MRASVRVFVGIALLVSVGCAKNPEHHHQPGGNQPGNDLSSGNLGSNDLGGYDLGGSDLGGTISGGQPDANHSTVNVRRENGLVAAGHAAVLGTVPGVAGPAEPLPRR